MTEMFALVGAFLATIVAIPALVRITLGWGLVDVAVGRKVHEGEVPLIGGIAMGVVFLGGYLTVALVEPEQTRVGLALATAVVLAGGILDDLHELRSLAKFAFQIVAAAVLIFADSTVLTQLGYLLNDRVFTLGAWSIPLTVFAVVGVMNAFNMADGIDGLAGSVSLLGFASFGLMAAQAGEAPVLLVCCLAGGVTVGFLCFNMRTPMRSRAAVFMGDTGSQFLGLLLAWCAIRLHNAQPPILNAVTAGWIVGVILGDTLCVMIRRALRGRSPFHGDREHLHHLLIAAGLSITQTVSLIVCASVAAGAIAWWAERQGIPAYVMFYLYLGILAVHCAIAEYLCRRLGLRKDSRAEAKD